MRNLLKLSRCPLLSPRNDKHAEFYLNPGKDGGSETLPAMNISRLDLRVGRIISTKPHYNYDRVYVNKLDIGEKEPRSIVSAVRHLLTFKDLEGKMALALLNLKFRHFKGTYSQGMLLFGIDRADPSRLELVEAAEETKPGTRVTVTGFTGDPDPMLNTRAELWSWMLSEIKVEPESGELFYKSQVFQPRLRLPTLRQNIVIA